MKATSFLCVLLLALFSVASAELYGVNIGFGHNDTQIQYYFVDIDESSGNWTVLSQALSSLFISFDDDGLSGFDQEEGVYYFATNFDASFLYSINANTGEVLSPVITNSKFISAILYDEMHSQMLLCAVYGNDSLVLSLPDGPNDPIGEMFNLTTAGIVPDVIYHQFVDNVNGDYYVLYEDAGLQIAQFSLSEPSPTPTTTTPYTCDNEVVTFIAYDGNLNKFVGLVDNFTTDAIAYFEIVNGACSMQPIKSFTRGLDLCASYDPVAHNIYFDYIDNFGSYVRIWNTVSYTLDILFTPSDLLNIEASYGAVSKSKK